MLSGMLLHVVTSAFHIDEPTNCCAWREDLVYSMPDLAVFIFGDVFDRGLDLHSGFRCRDERAGIEWLSSTAWIERSAIQLYRPRGLIVRAREFPRIQHLCGEVVEKRIVVVEALSHGLAAGYLLLAAA